MNDSLTVIGLASLNIVKIIPIPIPIPTDLSLMNFLIENGITIASSCGGVGACSKCLINQNLLSCQVMLLEFVKNTPSLRIEVSYL